MQKFTAFLGINIQNPYGNGGTTERELRLVIPVNQLSRALKESAYPLSMVQSALTVTKSLV